MKKGANLYLNEPKYVWRPGALPRPAGQVPRLPRSNGGLKREEGDYYRKGKEGRGGRLLLRGRKE